METRKPIKIINGTAPIRVCDLGGWTDTWFAKHGRVFNIGVYPYVEVQIMVYPRESQPDRVVLVAENFGDKYVVPLDHANGKWINDKHQLLEAAIQFMGVPEKYAVRISIFSEAPSGCSTGTSAAVSVALIGALSRLTPKALTNHEVAEVAHHIETEILGQQSGIQDKLCSAYGGVNLIDMHQYPHASVSPVQMPNAEWWEVERRLCLVYLGRPHTSSAIHERVIADLEGGSDLSEKKIDNLRQTALLARDALGGTRVDFEGFGRAMILNNEYQRALHPYLICAEADQIFDVAKRFGALGWKVNGAGGEGGSVTILCNGDMPGKREMVRAIEGLTPEGDYRFRQVPIYLSRYGLRVWSVGPK